MPELLNPEWEFWEPDAEIAEIMAVRVLAGFAGLASYRDVNHGFRFGCGNPNFCRFRLAPPKPEPDCKPLESRVCKGCGYSFMPNRRSRRYCSNRCYIRPGRARELLDCPCEACGVAFRPLCRSHRYCSRVCSNVGFRKREHDTGCPTCGCEVVRSGKGRSAAKIYCSRSCMRAAVNRRYHRIEGSNQRG